AAVAAMVRGARSGRRAGAPPGTGARARVTGAAHPGAGPSAAPLDEVVAARHASYDRAAPETSPAVDPADVVEDVLATLRRVAARDPRAAQLAAALDLVASPRDAAVWLTHADERATGNRSPAVTVA